MRKLAYLKTPKKCNDRDMVYKIVLHTDKSGVFVYLYTSPDAVQCSFDEYYSDEKDALDDWAGYADENGFIDIGDPMSYCQHDALIPLRVKGRDKGSPEWGRLEVYEDGEWKDYII